VRLHEEVCESCPARLAVEFLQQLKKLNLMTGGRLTPYAAALVPGGKARRPHACCTSLG
jgi:hypothetical protein